MKHVIAAALIAAAFFKYETAWADTEPLVVSSINGSAVVSGTGKTLSQISSAASAASTAALAAQSTASSASVTASSAVPKSSIGAANGVAGLDASGSLTAALNTTTSAASTSGSIGWNAAQTWAISGGTGTQYANPKVAFDLNWQTGVDASGNAVYDDYMPPNHLRLGGSQEYDGVPLFVHNVPYGPDNMGIVDGVFMQSQNMRGSEAGVGPDGAASIANYDNFDAVARYTYASGNSPVFVATGSAVTAPDGLTHIPTFTASGATFDNPLPAAWSQWVITHPHAHMVTNELGSSTATIKTYVGQLTGYTTNGTGLVTGITTDGWRIFGASSATSNQIPGTTTVDGSTAAIDTVWSNFKSAAIMFGVYTKAFDANAICNLTGPTPANTPGDINYPTGDANNQLRSCEGMEYDLWDSDTTNSVAYIHGITVAYSGTTPPPNGSYDMQLAGGNATMLQLGGEWYSNNIASRGFSAAGYGGPAYTAGSQTVIADFDQSNRPGWDADSAFPQYSHNMRVTLWNTRNVDDTNNTNDYQDFTTSIGIQVDGHTSNTLALDGTVQEHMEFNPAAFPNGIALCGYQVCGFAVNGSGEAQFSAAGHVLGGNTLDFVDSGSTQRGTISASTDGTVHITPSAGTTGGVTIDGVRRRKIWDYGWCEITEALAHLLMVFRRRAADEASVVSGW